MRKQAPGVASVKKGYESDVTSDMAARLALDIDPLADSVQQAIAWMKENCDPDQLDEDERAALLRRLGEHARQAFDEDTLTMRELAVRTRRWVWEHYHLLPGGPAHESLFCRPRVEPPEYVLRLYDLLPALAPPEEADGIAPDPNTISTQRAVSEPWRPGERLTILSDPETQLFFRVAWDMSNGDLSRLIRPDVGVAYYQGDGGGQIYAAPAPLSDTAALDPREQEMYTRKILSLDDDHVVAYAACIAKWFADRGGERDSKGEPVIIKTRFHVNDGLRFMGYAPHKGKRDFDPEQKRKLARDIWALSEIIIRAPQTIYTRGKRPMTVMVHSRLLEVAQENKLGPNDEETPYTFLIAPGEYAKARMREDGAMTAHLLRPIVEVGAHRGLGRIMALRIGFYLTMQWRIRASHGNYEQPWTVETLLQGGHIPIATDTRERQRFCAYFDEALDSLCERGALKGWHYLDWDPGARPHRDWFKPWLQAKVLILPPDMVVQHYARILPAARRAVAAAKSAGMRQTGT
jgi:hypothetical protein